MTIEGFDLPPSPEQLQAIGMVAVEWSYLESVIAAAIGELAGLWDPGVMETVTVHLPFNARMQMLTTLHNHRCDVRNVEGTEDRSTEFGSIAKIVQSLAGRRNAIVHARWVRGSQGSPLTYEVQARGLLKQTTRGMPATEILEVAASIREQSDRLKQFFSLAEYAPGVEAE